MGGADAPRAHDVGDTQWVVQATHVFTMWDTHSGWCRRPTCSRSGRHTAGGADAPCTPDVGDTVRGADAPRAPMWETCSG